MEIQSTQIQYVISKADLEAMFREIAEEVREKSLDRFLTATETAKRLHCTRITLYRWEKEGKLIPQRIGPKGKAIRYRESEVNQLIQA